ncbi:MAG: protein kinase, partial [Verrucomicrobiales bacterium]|nr:protein kinase [Verrucomicrobiales bacterium]
MTTIRYVGDYMLLGHLGRGAMGEVWVARQLTLRKTVALKLIRPEYVASDGAKARFLAEARAAARVLHPNIVTLFEYGEHDGALFLAMQYVEGGDLAALLAARRLSARASATLLAKVARAVHHAHQNQVVHRDLKPANILVDESLEPYLTDFGVAKRLDDEATLTRVGDVVGTLRYMAPEQAAGHERITTAADVWGLGAILFEMLAGEPLWDGDPRSVARRLSAEEPRRLRRVCPGLDRDLDTICHACLVREPEGRYASAAALAEDLERWLRGEPIGARPVGAVERTLKWACRHPSTSVAIGVVVACVALWAGLEWRRSVRERTEYRRLLMRQADGAFRAGEDREGYATLGKLAALAPNDPEPRVRLRSALAYRSLALPAVPPLRHGAVLNAVVFGPDDRWIATGGDGGTVKVWDRGRGTLFATASSAAASLHGLAFFGADRLLGFGRGGALDAWAIEAGGLRRLWSRSFPDTVVWAAPVGDATRVAAANVGGGLMVLDAATGDIRFRRAVVTNALTCAAASPDGDWLAVGGSRGEWALVDWARDVVLHRPADDGLGIARVAFGPDRDVVVVGGDDGSLRKLKLGSGVDPVAELTLSAGVTALAFSPDGARLFVGCADGRVDAVDVAPWSLLSKPAFLPHGGPVTSLALSSDGLRGVSADGAGEVRSWDTREGRWLAMPVAMSKWVSRVALAPGGTSFAAASFDGSAGVWDLRPARNQVLVEAADDVLPKHKPLNAVASDRNGAVVVGRENGEIVLFGPGGEGGPVAFGRLPNAIQSLEFDSAGRRLLVGCADGTASLYET